MLSEEQGEWVPGACREASITASGGFRFLNVEADLPTRGGWNDPHRDKLWLYNLHYFDDLNADGSANREAPHRALIERWIAENPPGQGNGWEPYPASLRIVNWVKWLARGNAPVPGMLDSLAQQTRWLARRLEWHLLGNHLFANAKGLAFAGALFSGPEARRWSATAAGLICDQLPEQILPDGGNFERSTMYHAIFLEDVLDLLNLTRWKPATFTRALGETLAETSAAMLAWLDGMTHPDGEIALFNDAAIGIAPSLAELAAYAVRLDVSVPGCERRSGCTLTEWPDSGYIRMACGAATLLADIGPVGPDYLPAHAHADTLSFELSLGVERVVVNGGTSRYGSGAERNFERSTAAHSTVEVAGQDSSEVWGGFRVARRARPFDRRTAGGGASVELSCSHDGYRRLAGRPIHRRDWRLVPGGLSVSDTVLPDRHSAVARFILHPEIRVEARGEGRYTLTTPRGQLIAVTISGGQGELREAQYAPRFGVILPTQCLAVTLSDGRSTVEFDWENQR
jgi:uncharacterized heparinase superfamily protein